MWTPRPASTSISGNIVSFRPFPVPAAGTLEPSDVRARTRPCSSCILTSLSLPTKRGFPSSHLLMGHIFRGQSLCNHLPMRHNSERSHFVITMSHPRKMFVDANNLVQCLWSASQDAKDVAKTLCSLYHLSHPIVNSAMSSL